MSITPHFCPNCNSYKKVQLSLNSYQEQSSVTANFPEDKQAEGLSYCALGLNGEAGEYAEVIKKLIRDDKGQLTPERKDKAKKELGDVLWYLGQSARLLGFSLEEVAQTNLNKLLSRKSRNKIHGDGDDR